MQDFLRISNITKHITTMKKDYIIVSANNKWLATLTDATIEDVVDNFAEIVENDFNDGEQMFAYETVGEPIESLINSTPE